VLAFDQIGSRLRLGDLIAVYYPTSTRHADRANRFVGIARVVGVRRAEESGHAWIDFEPAHRFDPPLATDNAPRRVFMCCDPGWPAADVSLFEAVFDAAVAAGWQPEPDERGAAPVPTTPVEDVSTEGDRLFAGVDYSGNMRDPRQSTWLAVVALRSEKLRVLRLEPTGRSGLQSVLRNPDKDMLRTEAIGLGFPFGLPLPFAESLLGGSFPDEGWWALARRLESLTWPDYLSKLQEFRDAHGEIRRLADESAGAPSPLHRVDPDMGSRSYHGVRMIAEERSRYAIRPFENAQGRLVFEVHPPGSIRKLGFSGALVKDVLSGLSGLSYLPLEIGAGLRKQCVERRDALDAVVAARCAAVAVLTGEAELTPDELAPEHGEQVGREGWIYGLREPA
jgi:hypothetical protein